MADDQQPTTADAKKVAITGAIIIVVLITLVAAVYGFDRLLTRWDRPKAPFGPPPEAQVPPKPWLQSSPAIEQKQHRQEKLKELNSWGWVDKEHGIAHIPIERAMELLIKKENQSNTR